MFVASARKAWGPHHERAVVKFFGPHGLRKTATPTCGPESKLNVTQPRRGWLASAAHLVVDDLYRD